ncbi:Ankyrin repeat and BTB/POZ domain-containing protein 1 [Vermiconidia calcicola]|uniref:Ankyrin repeat and BTB/POZ domain-containing protein 1 n=1 Tax=Vermiconidia calcicola TaxID=1690605 RepID=A0ACC3N659_9PEZI|nr:Ankyrin repeat and BTB/POZ domain-containing protein 1 [Vermiconidia calcicola]
MSSANEEPAKKRPKHDYKDTITVLVGHERTPYMVHKTVFCTQSPFFQTATNGNYWLEAKEKTVSVPEATEDTFEAYIHWAYTSAIDLSTAPKATASHKHADWDIITRLWILADMLMDEQLCNGLTDLMLTKFDEDYYCMHPATLCTIWEQTSAESQLRKVCIDIMSCTSWENIEADATKLPQEFLIEFMRRYFENEEHMVGRQGLHRYKKCRYHVHRDSTKCGS